MEVSDSSNFSTLPAPIYDLALSYAGEDRPIAEDIATRLRAAGYEVFFDRFEQARLIGEDLSKELGEIYENRSRYCLILISSHYVNNPWTNHERQFALSRALRERGAYILPLQIDGSRLPGLSATIGYLNLRDSDVPSICRLLAQKLGPPATRNPQSGVARVSKARIRNVLSVCYRRAIFTRLHAQMNHGAMLASLASCRVALQKRVVNISPTDCQALVAGIIGEIDLIERTLSKQYWTAETIDGAKLRIIHSLRALATKADVPIEFPRGITEELIWRRSDADLPPAGPETWDGFIGKGGSLKRGKTARSG